jgi:hypothetical protein
MTGLLMKMLMHGDILKACRILFGPEADLSLDFLYYMQSSGIKSAYRKRALETHPDVAGSGEGYCPGEGDADAAPFIETHWAYKRLIEFIGTRDSHHSRRHQPMRVPGTVVQPGRRRMKRRARKTAAGRTWAERHGGHYYKGPMPRRRLMLGEYLFYGGFVPWEALIKAIVWQRRQRPRFGDMALRWGWLKEGQISVGFRFRRLGEPLGQSLLRHGMLSEAQLGALIMKQRGLQSPIGEFFVQGGYLSASRLQGYIERHRRHNESH